LTNWQPSTQKIICFKKSTSNMVDPLLTRTIIWKRKRKWLL
jgi:hypothetical protein